MTPQEHNRESEEQHDNEFASPDDFKVQRGSDGELLPQTEETQLGVVRVIPMAYGDIEEYFGSASVADIGPAEIADILDDHVVDPDLSQDAGGRMTAEYVETMKPIAPRELLFAVLNASGIDADVEMDEAGGAEVAVGN